MIRLGAVRCLTAASLAAACLFVFSSFGYAQSGTGTLTGAVVDQQGAAIPGAAVVLTDPATGATRETLSGEAGIYRLLAVPPGVYTLTVELSGFRQAVVEGVRVLVDSTVTQNVKLVIGNVSETIQVMAEASALNRSGASLGNVINGEQIRNLPLEGRNVVGLLSLQTGVTFIPTTNANTVDPRYGSVSGSRADQSNVTLDGVDVNDSENQSAFTSALRVTLDSVEEFRVTTSNYGADQGRSSGAQVSLVTRSGTNSLHGAGYWSNRDTRFSANEYFLKLAQVQAGEESEAPLLNKNIFGASIGGPLKRDRVFYFFNFEGLNEESESPVTRDVPSDSFRDGVLIYQCQNLGECPGGSVQGYTGSHAVPAGFYGLTPAEITRIDPLHIGPNQAALDFFRQMPSPNELGNYPNNIDRIRFASPIENTFRTYVGRMDVKPSGNHSIFGRFIAQDDAEVDSAQFPGSPSRSTNTASNWGLALGHDWVLGPNIVNTMRYGYTLIDEATIGLQNRNVATFRFIDDVEPLTDSFGRSLATHNIVNDLSWVQGKHTWKFGTNLRFVRNDNYTNQNSFHLYVSNPSWSPGSGTRWMPGGVCPPPGDCSGLPAVAEDAVSSYSDPFMHMLGVVNDVAFNYNYNIDGSLQEVGDPVRRLYAANEFEFYVQDTWRLRDNLTVTGGLRYSLFSPPYEANGVQVATTPSMGEWFAERQRNMAAGIPSNQSPLVQFEPAGPKHDRPGFYEWDRNNFSPRLAVAWTPSPEWVFRGGYSLVYDRIGAGIASSFDAGGSFGLSTEINTPFGSVTEQDAFARFGGVDSLAPELFLPAPPGGFPQVPEIGAGVITISLDDTLVTPYSHVFSAVAGRELGNGFGIEAAYVGRIGRNQVVRRDLAMPLNLVDPQSGMDYFTAARLLIDAARSQGAENVAPIAYWENLFPDAAGVYGDTATQSIAALWADVDPDWQTALWLMDQGCDPACSKFGPFAYYSQQYDSLAALSTIGRSEYHSLQLTARKRFSAGYQFDVNYTLSRSEDHASEVERGDLFDNAGAGGYSGFLINSWEPDRNYSYSDYDVRHQVNMNWLTELPFGRNKPLGSNASSLLNAFIGDWSIAGLLRWSSGYPFNVINCRSCWATNWNLQGNAELVDPDRLPETGTTRGDESLGGNPSVFPNREEAIEFFRRLYPGETGIRNQLRGDGVFGIDLSLSKSFAMPFGHRLLFRWDVFNVTNTPRFNVSDIDVLPDRQASFGRYNSTLPVCDGLAGRCMQGNLRYEW